MSDVNSVLTDGGDSVHDLLEIQHIAYQYGFVPADADFDLSSASLSSYEHHCGGACTLEVLTPGFQTCTE
jgi:hypothetical protein